MTIEYRNKEGVWTPIDKGSVCIAATPNEWNMYSVMATPLDEETLMIYGGFTPFPIPDPLDPNAEVVVLYRQQEIENNYYTKRNFRYVPSSVASEPL